MSCNHEYELSSLSSVCVQVEVRDPCDLSLAVTYILIHSPTFLRNYIKENHRASTFATKKFNIKLTIQYILLMLCSVVLSLLLCVVGFCMSPYVVSNQECCRRWLIPAKQRTHTHHDSQMIRGYKKKLEKPRGIIDHAGGEPCSNGAVSQPLHTGYLYVLPFI